MVGSDGTGLARIPVSLDGQPYQVIARPVYMPASRTMLRGIVGFTVNLNWVRAHYFNELAAQMARDRSALVRQFAEDLGAAFDAEAVGIGEEFPYRAGVE